ncbi:MAG: hypothetical protein H6868_01000 [Rhodospirillales bacterium]|nr:hypothetical protein [Rhodospirillales bacterium]
MISQSRVRNASKGRGLSIRRASVILAGAFVAASGLSTWMHHKLEHKYFPGADGAMLRAVYDAAVNDRCAGVPDAYQVGCKKITRMNPGPRFGAFLANLGREAGNLTPSNPAIK